MLTRFTGNQEFQCYVKIREELLKKPAVIHRQSMSFTSFGNKPKFIWGLYKLTSR